MKRVYYYLYVIIDIFSRHVVGWMVASRESERLAEVLIRHSCANQGVSALSNAAALENRAKAYLIWGITDAGHKIVGTSFRPDTAKSGNEDLQHWLVRGLRPQVHFEFRTVEIDGKIVVVLEIQRAAFQPTAFKGIEYIRAGSYKKQLRDHPEHARRLWRSFEQGTFEAGIAAERLAADDALALLDHPAYFDLMGMPQPEHRPNILAAMEADGLVVRAMGDLWSITNLGALLFAKRLDAFPGLRRKRLRVVLYAGNSRVRTVKEHVAESGYASGFSGEIGYINDQLPSNEVVKQAIRETVKMYPSAAVRELVANALIHQDFSITGTGPFVEIFDDRVEISNPGRPLVEPLRFVDSPPRSRNERLADIMRRAGICEERGSGWDKIGFQVEVYQLPAPLVEVTPEHTRVTLYGHRELNDMDRADRVRAVYLHACLLYVSHRRVTNTTVRERFGIEPRNSAKASRLIKEAMDDGMISPRDPSAPKRLMEYVPFWASGRS